MRLARPRIDKEKIDSARTALHQRKLELLNRVPEIDRYVRTKTSLVSMIDALENESVEPGKLRHIKRPIYNELRHPSPDNFRRNVYEEVRRQERELEFLERFVDGEDPPYIRTDLNGINRNLAPTSRTGIAIMAISAGIFGGLAFGCAGTVNRRELITAGLGALLGIAMAIDVFITTREQYYGLVLNRKIRYENPKHIQRTFAHLERQLDEINESLKTIHETMDELSKLSEFKRIAN